MSIVSDIKMVFINTTFSNFVAQGDGAVFIKKKLIERNSLPIIYTFWLDFLIKCDFPIRFYLRM